ncbi:uncharacterized [Tachysurus ichikawai]
MGSSSSSYAPKTVYLDVDGKVQRGTYVVCRKQKDSRVLTHRCLWHSRVARPSAESSSMSVWSQDHVELQ